jgi:uncharacterized membrane protein
MTESDWLAGEFEENHNRLGQWRIACLGSQIKAGDAVQDTSPRRTSDRALNHERQRIGLATAKSKGAIVIRVQVKTVVARPIDVVFSYLADFSHLPEHDPWVNRVELTSPASTGVGATWVHERTQGRRTIEAPIEVVAYEPNSRLTIKSGSKGFDVRAAQTFRAVGDNATEVTEDLEMRLFGVVRLFEPLIRRQVPKQTGEVHRRFKEILEKST